MLSFVLSSVSQVLIAFSLVILQSAPSLPQSEADGTPPDSSVVYVSPATGATQGYATDGTNHYLFSTAGIQEDDADWNQLFSNANPFSGLPSGVIHVGDGAYFQGMLFAPVESFKGCNNVTHQTVAVYAANRPGLPLVRYSDISANGHEASSVTVAPSTNSLYVSSFCDGSKLWIYDLYTLKLKGTLALSTNILKIQGISWNPAQSQFAVTADSADQNTGYIYLVSASGAVTGPVYTVPQKGELEGVDYTQSTIRYLIDGRVYFVSLAAR
jgi:WD40 repeat protein